MPTKFQSSLTAQEIENRLVNANVNDQLLIRHIEVFKEEEKTLLTIISEPFVNDKIVKLINTTNLVRICIPKSKGSSWKKKSFFKHICPNSFFECHINKETGKLIYEHLSALDELTEEEFLESKLILPITKKNLKMNKDGQYYITYTINMNDILKRQIQFFDYDYIYIPGDKFYKNPESLNNDDNIQTITDSILLFDRGNHNDTKTLINKYLNQKFFRNSFKYRSVGGSIQNLSLYHPQSQGLILSKMRNDKIKTYSTIFVKKENFPTGNLDGMEQYITYYNEAVKNYSEVYPLAFSNENLNKRIGNQQHYNSFCFAILKENYNQEPCYMFDKKYKYFSKTLCHKYYLGISGITNYGILKHTF